MRKRTEYKVFENGDTHIILGPDWEKRGLYVAILTGKVKLSKNRLNGSHNAKDPYRPKRTKDTRLNAYDFAYLWMANTFRGQQFTLARACEWMAKHYKKLDTSSQSVFHHLRRYSNYPEYGFKRVWKDEPGKYPSVWESV